MVQSANMRIKALERSSAIMTNARSPLLHFFFDRYAESFALELAAFIDAVRTGSTPLVGFKDGFRAQLVAEAAAHSAATGKTVRVSYRDE